MTIKSIFLFAPAASADPHCGPAAYAIELAKAYAANLTLFVVNLDVTTPGRYVDPVHVGEAISAAADAADVKCVTITEHSHSIGINEVVAEHARLHDVTIAGCSVDGILSEKYMVEYLLFESGRPILIVPAEHRGPFRFNTVAIAWDNTSSAARALGDATSLIGAEKVIFLSIDGDKQVRGDLDHEEVLTNTLRRGLNAQFETAACGDRSISEALQAEAERHNADLLVMGGFGHSKLRRFVLGGATAGVLEMLSIPTLMSH